MRLFIRSAFFLSLLISLFSTALFSTRAQAQPQVDTTHWNDEELYTEETSSAPYFAIAGGVLGGMFMPNLDAFNKQIAQPFVRTDIDNQVFMIGGQGFVALPWIKGVRVGGMGYGGQSKQCCVDTVLFGLNYSRRLEYNVGFGGITLDYVLPLDWKTFHIVPGIVLGLGSVDIYAQQAFKRDSFSIQADFDVPNLNMAHTYHSSFFLYNPQLQFEYNPLPYMMVRAFVGYQGTAMGDWEVDNGVPIKDQKNLNDINGSGLSFGLGVFFGLF